MGYIKLLKASAGSGKTYQLAYEYVRAVVEDPSQYRHILAVTFTNKATEEMKRRIVAEINDLATGKQTSYLVRLTAETGWQAEEIHTRALSARTKILHDYSRFSVLTIDKFFQRIIRSFIRELGIDLNFNLELQTTPLLSRAADRLVDEISVSDRLRRWIVAFVEEKIEENKRWEIKSELVSLGGEIFRERFSRAPVADSTEEQLGSIVAQASREAAAIKAGMAATARKALEIISDNGLSVSDFSGGARSFANYFVKVANRDLEPPGKSVVSALGSDDKWAAKTSPHRDQIEALIPSLRPLLQGLCDEYESNITFLNGVELIRRNYRNFGLLNDLRRKVETICSEEGRLPISETNKILSRLIAGNDTPFIFEKAGNHFTRFMIDEFQDTSSLQWENFVPLLRNSLSQSAESPVLLVGDVKQSIYRWRGGDWQILAREIEREFGDLATINLDTNFRSYGNVVDFNNKLISECVTIDNSAINSSLDDTAGSGLIPEVLRTELHDTLAGAYSGHSQETSKCPGEGCVTVTVYDPPDEDNRDTAVNPVIRRIEDLQERGFRAGDIAVLVRTRAEAVGIANMLLEHKGLHPESGYSYNVVTQEALILTSSEVVGFVTACFRLATAPAETIYLAVFNKWLGRALDAPPEPSDIEFLAGISFLPPEEAFEAVAMKFGLDTKPGNIAYLQALQEQILSFSSSSVSDLQLFLKWWDENGDTISVEVPAGEDAIMISTIHKAKGLQYKAVIIPYCNWNLNPRTGTVLWADADSTAMGLGMMPVAYSERMRNSPMAAEYYREMVLSHVDNMNIFYVAVTRAMEELHIMMPTDKKRRENRINTLVLDALGKGMADGTMIGTCSQEENGAVYSFGSPVQTNKLNDKDKDSSIHTAFRSFPVSGRLRLRMPTDRYIEDRGGGVLSPRDYGILMHHVFESATDPADIEHTILSMEQDGKISAREAAMVKDKISDAFSNPTVGAWFTGDWDTVRIENDIIVPGNYSQRRPDRVMLRGSHAVLVDYKFGLARRPSHRQQISGYSRLLRQMGYEHIEGYIWYVSLGDVEKVDLSGT